MSETTTQKSATERWISYRPEIKILDCTIRDGGLMNDHKFDDETVSAVYRACVEGGIDYMEIGYINSRRIFSAQGVRRLEIQRRRRYPGGSSVTTIRR